MPNDYTQLKAELEALKEEFYRNNFSDSQDFVKYSRFNTRLKVPTFSADPTIGAVGDIVSVSGKLKICTTASLTSPTWTIVGTQS
jgi:hypothetical protein